MGILSNLVPGIRELRAPLAAGYLWLLCGWLMFGPFTPRDEATRTLADLYELSDQATAIGLGVAVSFAAYLAGSVSEAILRQALESQALGLFAHSFGAQWRFP